MVMNAVKVALRVRTWTTGRHKIVANRARDARQEQALRDLGWRVFAVWGCELKPSSLQASVERLDAALNKVPEQSA